MAAGIRDASNLAWKLADVIAGGAGDDLLDTYESERSPHVREFIETAVRLGGLIQTKDPEEARRRDRDMLASPQVFATPQPRLGPGLHASGGAAGIVGEQPRLADGVLLDDRAGDVFALLVDPAWGLADLAGQLAPRVQLISADSPAARDWLQRLGAGAVLLRPDRYVAGVAAERGELDALLRFAAAAACEQLAAA
jgi:3-(3-hydroxy-phenyl)propionate hydroxylase